MKSMIYFLVILLASFLFANTFVNSAAYFYFGSMGSGYEAVEVIVYIMLPLLILAVGYWAWRRKKAAIIEGDAVGKATHKIVAEDKYSFFIMGGFLMFFSVNAIISISDIERRTQIRESRFAEVEAAKNDALQVPIKQLLSDYKNNEINAGAKYEGKWIKTSGLIKGFGKGHYGTYVTLGNLRIREFPTLNAFINYKWIEKVSALSKLDRLTVICNIKEISIGVVRGMDCDIEK